MRHRSTEEHLHGPLSSSQLSPATWPDFETLFAANGGVWGGCWCMFFHKRGDFDSRAYERNRKTKQALTSEGKAHGTIVYCGSDPVGWCEYGPREELPRIDGKRGYRPTASDPWRVTCLFVAPGHRKSGLAGFAVNESLKAMKKLKIQVVESYPVDGRRSASLLWMGTPHLFESLGFTRVGPLGKGSWIYSLNMGRA